MTSHAVDAAWRPRHLTLAALQAAGVASVANAALAAAAVAALAPMAHFEPLQLRAVTVCTFAAVLVGAVAYGVLLRIATRPQIVFRLLVAAAVAASAVPVLTLPDATAAAMATLLVLHALAAAVTVVWLPRHH